MASKLRRTSTLTITRQDTSKTLSRGRFSGGTQLAPFDIQASVQPYTPIGQVVLPEGYTSKDARTIYTDTRLRTSSQFDKLSADTTEIDGLTFVCFDDNDYNLYGLKSDHYVAHFIRKDQPS